MKVDEIYDIKNARGLDPTIDLETGRMKDWQIKNLGEKDRLAIKGFMDYNEAQPEDMGNIKKKRNIMSNISDKKIVVFDDNLSSGATLDDICLFLIVKGAKKENILCITLGKMKHTEFDKSLRLEIEENEKDGN